jgi:hypothetical protein
VRSALTAAAPRRGVQKRKGGTDPRDSRRAVKRTKTALADRELEMAPDAITAPRPYAPSGTRRRLAPPRRNGARCALAPTAAAGAMA